MSLKVSVIPGHELTADLICQWRLLQHSNPTLGSPYFCPEFTQAVASVRGDVEIAVLEETTGVVGFFPYQRTVGSVAVPVGGILSDYQGIIAGPAFTCQPAELLKACRLIAWDFDHLVASQEYFAPFHLHREVSPLIDLSNGFPAYAADCHAVSRTKKIERQFEKEIGPLRFVTHAVGTEEFDRVLGWKSQQYLATGGSDLFAMAWIRRLLENIQAREDETFAGMLSLLYAGDRLAAGHFGMRSRTCWHYWFPSYDKGLTKYSPGMILLLKMAEHAPSLGLWAIDLGKGMSAYKERLMNASVDLASGSVERPSWRSFRRGVQRGVRSMLADSIVAEPGRRVVRWARGVSRQLPPILHEK